MQKLKLILPDHLLPSAVEKTAPTEWPAKFRIGTVFGEFTVIRKIRRNRKLSSNLAIRWKCRCSCGDESIVPEYYMRRVANPKWHCGHLNSTLKTIYKEEYGIWYMMHRRTEDKNHKHYNHYGGRGIRVCDEWNKAEDKAGTIAGFEAFLRHIGPRPSKKYSVDRIDNDDGYRPGNVKWATAKEQRANQRPAGST